MNHEQQPLQPQETPETLETASEYNNEGIDIIDREREAEFLKETSTTLIFAASFTFVLSPFLTDLHRRLKLDPTNIIKDAVIYRTQMMHNSSLEPYVPPNFSPPWHIVVVSALFYASLGFTVLAAFAALLIKRWVLEFSRGLQAMSIPEQRARTRQFRYLGMERRMVTQMVGILPWLFQMSLLLFVIGLCLLLFHISILSFGLTTVILAVCCFCLRLRERLGEV